MPPDVEPPDVDDVVEPPDVDELPDVDDVVELVVDEDDELDPPVLDHPPVDDHPPDEDHPPELVVPIGVIGPDPPLDEDEPPELDHRPFPATAGVAARMPIRTTVTVAMGFTGLPLVWLPETAGSHDCLVNAKISINHARQGSPRFFMVKARRLGPAM